MAPKRGKPRNPRRGLRYGEGYVSLRAPGVAQARWPEDGRWRAKTFRAPTDDEAWERAEDFVRTQARKHRGGTFIEPHDRTVREVIDGWLERGRHRWKPNSWHTYRTRADRHVIPVLGAIRADELTTPRVQHLVDQMARDGHSPALIEGAIHTLRAAFREAVRLDIVDRNPAYGVQLPAKRKRKPAVWRAPEIKAVLDYLRDDPMWLALYQLALTTGLRPGELRALKWSDLDWDSGALRVERTMTRSAEGTIIVGETTKRGESRDIVVPRPTLDVLQAWRSTQVTELLASGKRFGDAYMFASDVGTPIAQSRWQRRHAEIIQGAKVPRITPHGLRHSAATFLMRTRVKDKVVSEMLGHSSVAITLDIYSHTDLDDMAEASEAMELMLGNPKTA